MKKILLLVCSALLFSCSSDNGSESQSDGYDRTALLNAVVENNILPAYNDFNTKLSTLKTDVDTFVSNPETTTLASVKVSYLEAYKVWQHLEMFNVLLAAETEYKEDVNTYPVDAIEINSFIDGSFGQSISQIDFTKTSKNDAQGFPAIDYLINNGDTSVIVANFTGDSATEYKNLLSLYINRLIGLTDVIIKDWGARKATFIADNGNSLTSSFNLFINDYIFYTEKGFREAKIVFPAGLRDKVEAKSSRIESFYSPENSKALFLESLKGIQNIFNGTPYKTQNTAPVGIKDYLEYLNAEVMVDGQDVELSGYIKNTLFTEVQLAADNLDANLANQINLDNSKMEAAFTAIQELIIAIKVNTLESFRVDVDYVDSDGD